MVLPNSFRDLLEDIADGKVDVNPTEIYNEGWMLRLLIYHHSKGNNCFPFPNLINSKWFSEVQLNTPFKHRYKKDPLAETRTHADGIFGHLVLEENTRAGIKLDDNATQFFVLEAKMKSALSKRVTNAEDYDQAARTIACMARTIEISNQEPDEIDSLGFHVVAPASRINEGLFDNELNIKNVQRKIHARIGMYSEDKDHFDKLLSFEENYIQPVIERVNLEPLSYEDLLEKLTLDPEERDRTTEFYLNCKKHNGLD